MGFRVSFFFTQQDVLTGGYSENWYNNGTELAAVQAAAMKLQKALYTFKGYGVTATKFRIADLTKSRAATTIPTPGLVTPVTGVDYDADYVNTAALIKLTAGGAYNVRQWIRSVPDDCTQRGGIWAFKGSAKADFNKVRGLVLDGSQGWVIRTLDKGIVGKDVTACTSAGVVTIPGHGYDGTIRIRIQHTHGITGLNKIWKFTVIDANSIQLAGVPVGGFTGSIVAPIGYAKLQSYIFQTPSDMVVDRVTTHRTGRPFGLHSGRRKVRKT